MENGHLALETTGLGRRYGNAWALKDCTLTVRDMLAFGRRLNARWDEPAARMRLERLAGEIAQLLASHRWVTDPTYQPVDRFWLFQGIETGIFLALAALLIGLAFLWLP